MNDILRYVGDQEDYDTDSQANTTMDEAIGFTYSETDSYQSEISELYSYSEESEFFANRNAFEESMEDCGLPLRWKHMVPDQQSRAINHLLTTLEVSCRLTRIKSCRALAYLIQGNFGECLTIEEQVSDCQKNVFHLYQQGIFHAFVQQLLIEANISSKETPQHRHSLPSSQIFNESSELRVILSVLCTITETIYHAKSSPEAGILDLRRQFIAELQSPIEDELLTVTLFQMLNNFCGGQAQHYPVRKIAFLLWKIILLTLGGSQELVKIKENNRKLCNLEPTTDDTSEITKDMRPCSPPVMPDGRPGARTAISVSMGNKRKVCKQPAFDDAVFAYTKECIITSLVDFTRNDDNDAEMKNSDELNSDENNDNNQSGFNQESNVEFYNLDERIPNPMPGEKSEESASDSGIEDKDVASGKTCEDVFYEHLRNKEIDIEEEYPYNVNSKDSDTENPISSKLPLNRNEELPNKTFGPPAAYRGLHWKPKVRRADLSQHLSNIRQKFLGYMLLNDLETTFGLPEPVIEGISVLKRHLYVSLAEAQLEREDLIQQYPLTHGELNPAFRDQPAEKLYVALLPRLPQYMIALLKILLAASTSSKNKTDRIDSINIMAEINPDASSQSIVQTMKMSADANRHKEVIIKAISAILILLLKHFKTNHVYQFEYISQQLMFANCIPLILKFLSQDIYSYIVASRSSISAIDFPACVIGEQPELTTDAIELCSSQLYCWRNMFSCINLVRVLNKLTKWKHSRIMMLVAFKSSQTLLKALSVRQPMFQLYILKLLKFQLKFLGRAWKKNNMKLIGPIYQKVRHRLTDDWAYSNDNEARPWEFQAEEFTLQANINKFHQRRYQRILNPTGSKGRISLVLGQSDKFGEIDQDCIDEEYDLGQLTTAIQLSPHFESNYERWLEGEVFERNIDWDKLLNSC